MVDREAVLDAAHAFREGARAVAARPAEEWDGTAHREALVRHAAAAEEAGLVDDATMARLDAFERELSLAMWEALSGDAVASGGALAVRVAEDVFGDRRYRNRLDRQLAVCAAAVGSTAAEERVLVALDQVLRSVVADEVAAAARSLRGSQRRQAVGGVVPPPPPRPVP